MGLIAQIGYGHWGTNLARNLNTLAGQSWSYLVEVSPERSAKAQALYPHLRITTELEPVLADDDVSTVVIVTPAATHAPLARRALRAGKHVLVEKPLALATADAVELASLADSTGRVLMVGHTFEFVPAVTRMRQYLDENEVGDLLYLHSQRLNLGRIQSDINAFWSIGPHDISIANYLIGAGPEWVSARGARYLHDGIEDVMFVTLGYPGGILAHAHVSWLDPSKTRRTTVVGSKRMLVYDDLDAEAKLKVFDKGADRLEPEAYGLWQYKLRDGAMQVPPLPMVEPLAVELQHFLDCVRTGRRPRTDGWNGVRVVAALAAAETSLRNDGARTPVLETAPVLP